MLLRVWFLKKLKAFIRVLKKNEVKKEKKLVRTKFIF